jgi:uncharacterized protein YggE
MRLISLICLLAFAAAAQITDGVNVSVSRIVNIPPDQAEFSAVVAVSLDTTQQQAAQLFRDLGVSNPVVVSVAAGSSSYSCCYPNPDEPVRSHFFYQVSFTTSPDAVKDLAKKLDALQTALPEGVSSLQYAAVLNATTAAVESVRRTLLPQLMAEARAKAQSLSEAAGVKLGAVVGLSENAYGYGAPAGAFINTGLIYNSSVVSSGPQYTFYAMVKFATQ